MRELLGSAVVTMADLGASHEWTLHRAVLADGRTVFVKRADGPGGAFRAEANGLRWLAEAGAAPVPEVLAADDRTLVLPWLETGAPSSGDAERFGRELAALHLHGAPAYGAPWQGFIAELPLDNTGDDDWPAFYARRRLVPFLRDLDPVGVRLVERVIESLGELAGPAEPPSRIHGDLWSGNVLWSGGRGWLIDPAAHGGHRETDLAMLALFGAPHLDRIIAAYDEAAPLAPGWRDRIALHQLHPLLVHVTLYGGTYHQAVARAAQDALRAL